MGVASILLPLLCTKRSGGLMLMPFLCQQLEQRALLLDDTYIESLKQKIPALKAELDPLSQSKLRVRVQRFFGERCAMYQSFKLLFDCGAGDGRSHYGARVEDRGDIRQSAGGVEAITHGCMFLRL